MIPTTPLVRRRVGRGAKALDAARPNWRESVVGGFDVSSPFACVLAHVYGDYDEGLTVLSGIPINGSYSVASSARGTWAQSHGFERDETAPYSMLQAAWERKLA